MIDLRLGRWQDVLADVTCDALITDPPYSARTHEGFRSGGVSAGSISDQRGVISYTSMTSDDAVAITESWAPRTRKWAVIFGDHITAAWHAEAWSMVGWYVFAPIAWVRRDAPPRFSGDGPQRSAEWLTVARPRVATKCGSLPGYYLVNRVEGAVNGSQLPGQKNLSGMRALVRDYTSSGETVVDICAGTGTTLIAADTEGRVACGSEMAPKHHAIAQRRIAGGVTPDMFTSKAAE